MIRQLQLYFKLRPLLEIAERLCKMKLKVNVLISGLLLVLQAIVQVAGFFPPKFVWIPIVAHIVLEGALKILAAYRNPDGTSALLPYVPAKMPELPKDLRQPK